MVSTLELKNFISRSLTHFQKSSLHRIFSCETMQFEYVEDATDTIKLITLKEQHSKNMLIACYVHYKVLYPTMENVEVTEDCQRYTGVDRLTYKFNLEQLKQGWIYVLVKEINEVTPQLITQISIDWQFMMPVPIKMT